MEMALVVGGPADGREVQKDFDEKIIEGVRYAYVGINEGEFRYYVPILYITDNPLVYLFKRFTDTYPRRAH